MRSEIKLIPIAGVEIPVFDEPKGEAYEQAMKEITQKVEAKRSIKNNSEGIRTNLKTKLNIVANKMMMEDDEFILSELRNERKEIQNQLEDVVDYSGFDVSAYARKLTSDPAIQKMKTEAEEEMLEILEKVNVYNKALREAYETTVKFFEPYLSVNGKGSAFSTRRANANFNNYNNA